LGNFLDQKLESVFIQKSVHEEQKSDKSRTSPWKRQINRHVDEGNHVDASQANDSGLAEELSQN
jgi:hypothetical protein